MRAAVLLVLGLAVAVTGRELQEGSVGTAILNGRDTDRGRYKYIASLRFPYARSAGVKQSEFVCQGVLIRPDIVLTTVHCVANSGIWPTIRLASYETNGGSAEVRRVVATVWHTGYTGSLEDVTNDVALMQLDKPSAVRPVKVAPADYDPWARAAEVKLTIAGWGMTNDSPPTHANHLMRASQFVLTPKRCAEKWSVGDFAKQTGGWNSGKIMCGAYAGHNKAICYGDIGAPLIRTGASAASDLVLGLGSQSVCVGSSITGGTIYSNIAKYAVWIQNGIRILRTGMPSAGNWRVARKSEFVPKRSCVNAGHRCSETRPQACCSGKCFINACWPADPAANQTVAANRTRSSG